MVSALSSAIRGLATSMRRMERAAVSVARSGLSEVPVGPIDPVTGARTTDDTGATDLPGAMVDMLMAQRAFSAQLRVLRTADEMSREATELGKR